MICAAFNPTVRQEEWSIILAVACSRDVPIGGNQSQVLRTVVKLEDIVEVTNERSELGTRTSIRDGKAQSSEMPQVWDLVVRGRLKESAVTHVILFPEDTSGQSLGMVFTKNESGEWSASAPYSISIPAK